MFTTEDTESTEEKTLRNCGFRIACDLYRTVVLHLLCVLCVLCGFVIARAGCRSKWCRWTEQRLRRSWCRLMRWASDVSRWRMKPVPRSAIKLDDLVRWGHPVAAAAADDRGAGGWRANGDGGRLVGWRSRAARKAMRWSS